MSDVLEELRASAIELLESLLPPAFVLIGHCVGVDDAHLPLSHVGKSGVSLVGSPIGVDANDQHSGRLPGAQHDYRKHESLIWSERAQWPAFEEAVVPLPKPRHQPCAAVIQYL